MRRKLKMNETKVGFFEEKFSIFKQKMKMNNLFIRYE